MSFVSVYLPEHVGISVSERPIEIPPPPKSLKINWAGIESLCQSLTPCEMSRPNLGKRPKQDLNVSGITCLFKFWILLRNLPNCNRSVLGKGGREICRPMPLSLIFTILSHCLNTTAVNNYSVRPTGKWPRGDTVLKGSGLLAPLGDFGKYPNGPNPRNVGENAPKTFYRSLFALVLATLRFKKMARGTVLGREDLSAIEFLEIELVKKGFQTVNLLTGFVNPGGASLEMICVCAPNSIFSLNCWTVA